MKVEQTVSTRNQSTANFSTGKLFIFDNRYKEGVFKNTTLDDCLGNFEKTKSHLKELKVIPERRKDNKKWFEGED